MAKKQKTVSAPDDGAGVSSCPNKQTNAPLAVTQDNLTFATQKESVQRELSTQLRIRRSRTWLRTVAGLVKFIILVVVW